MIESIWIILFLIVWLGSLIISSENDSAILAYCVLVVGATISEFIFHIPIWATIVSNPMLILGFIVIYLAIGVLYAAKWELPSFLNKNKDRILSEYSSFKSNTFNTGKNPQKELTEEDFIESRYNTFKISENKDRILSWITLWPFKILWDLSHKPFIWVWNKIYYLTSTMFNEINNKILLSILKNK